MKDIQMCHTFEVWHIYAVQKPPDGLQLEGGVHLLFHGKMPLLPKFKCEENFLPKFNFGRRGKHRTALYPPLAGEKGGGKVFNKKNIPYEV
ncbi:MAG: hypothetical protein GX121_06150 [Ignavibacteria bacterium]|nr:hypothetical protein [Ignavibacteria bacterium]